MQTRIRECRQKLGITQEELADLVGVRRETIVHLEKGKYNPSLKLGFNLAKVLQMPVDELFSFEDE
jgi:putative transcriptional regulator